MDEAQAIEFAKAYGVPYGNSVYVKPDGTVVTPRRGLVPSIGDYTVHRSQGDVWSAIKVKTDLRRQS